MERLFTFICILSFILPFCTLHSQSLDNLTDVTLTFTPEGGGASVTLTATDSDGNGDGTFAVPADAIRLLESTEYVLTIGLNNSIDNTDLTNVVNQNADQFQFFIDFTQELIESPIGMGNIVDTFGSINYNDVDSDSLPIGLTTTWTSACFNESEAGQFRLMLRGLGDNKSSETNSNDGDLVFDLTFALELTDDPNAPPCENEEEIITDVILTWTPENGDPIIARAQDPDGEGPLDLVVNDDIVLDESTNYTLTLQLTNSIEGEDITDEIREEDHEHQFFFAWSEGLFANPNGNGNIDNSEDQVNYNDLDENNLPVGLSTDWTSACIEEATSGTFRIVLKHQPDVKSASSTADDGSTDIDLTFNVSIAEDPNAPPCENEEEIITDVVLTWTPTEGDPIIARAQDPDGEGPLDLEILDDITLDRNTTYTLSIEILNSIEGEDITEEIKEEAEEHQFFFAWSEGLFSSPGGDGNIDNRDDSVNYVDFDDNNLPIGLSTTWSTARDSTVNGTFRVVLKHQPDIKNAASTSNDGSTDIDLTFSINLDNVTSSHPLNGDYDLVIAPNPASDFTYVNIPDQLSDREMTISVFNLAGQRMLSQFVPRKAPTQIKLGLNSIQAGVYLILLQEQNGQLIQREKLIKTN